MVAVCNCDPIFTNHPKARQVLQFSFNIHYSSFEKTWTSPITANIRSFNSL